jgi:hypothetical protein
MSPAANCSNLDFFKKQGYITGAVDIDKCVDGSFAVTAAKALGAYKG